MRIIKPTSKELEKIYNRSFNQKKRIVSTVSKIIADVRLSQDDSVSKYTRRFDKVNLKPRQLRVTEAEISAAFQNISSDFISDLKKIIEYKRKLFGLHFRNIRSLIKNDGEFLANLDKSNEIRRKVMHTIRDPVTPDDAHFIGDFCNVVVAFVQEKGSQSIDI